MAFSGGGFAAGLVSGTALGNNIVNAYQAGVNAELEAKARRDNEEIAAEMRKAYEGGTYDPKMTEASLDSQQKAMLQANQQNQMGPGDATGPTTPGITPSGVARDTRTDEEKYLDAYGAAQRTAMRLNRPEIALRAFDATLPMRHKLRQDAFNKADNEFRQTGDFNAFVPFYNRFVNDGRTVEKVETTQIGNETAYSIVGTDQGGKQFRTPWMSKDKMQEGMSFVLDPAAVRAAEAKQRQAIMELQADIAKEKAKKPFIEMDPDKDYFTQDGKLVKRGSRLREIENSDGSKTLVQVANDGTQTIVFDGGSKEEGALSKGERKDVWEPANSALENDVKVAAANIPDEQRAKTLAEARSKLGNLIIANRGNENGSSRDPGLLSKAAAGIAAGTLKPTKVKLNDGIGTEADAVVMEDGTVIYTNPQQIRIANAKVRQREGAVANAPTKDDKGVPAPAKEPNIKDRGTPPKAATSPPDFPKVDKATQQERDSDRPRILNDELAAEEKKLSDLRSKGADQAEIDRSQANIDALKREISRLSGVTRGAKAEPKKEPTVKAPANAGLTPIDTSQPPAAPAAQNDTNQPAIPDSQIKEAYAATEKAVAEANRVYLSFGPNERRNDPAGYEAARLRMKAAVEARKKLSGQYAAAMRRERTARWNATGQPGLDLAKR